MEQPPTSANRHRHLTLMEDQCVRDSAPLSRLGLLPPEVWSKILDNLPYESVISFAATSTIALSVVCDALPSLTTLYIDHPSQLRVRGVLAEGLRDVRSIYISFTNEQDNDMSHDIAMMVSPFLCRLPRLKKVVFGHIDPFGKFRGGLFSLAKESMTHLIDTISGTFLCGAFPSHVTVLGLRCPHWNQPTLSGCSVCRRVCRSFPVPQALGFQHRCLPKNVIMGIIDSRRGASEYLRSEARLMQLLGSGTSKVMYLVETSFVAISMVHYKEEDLLEIDQLLCGHINVTSLSPSDVSLAVSRSCVPYGWDEPPSKYLCYLEETSFDYLKGKGIPIKEEEFLLVARMENLHHHIHCVMGGNYVMQVISSIQIRKLLCEQEPSTPVIRQLVASGVVAKFVECLQKDDVTMRIEALKICVDITHWIRSERAELAGECPFEALAEAGAYPHLIGLIGSRNDCLVEISAAAIGNIATFCPRHRDLLLKAGVMAPLVNLFNRFWTLSNVSMTRHVVKALANILSHPGPPEIDTSVQPQVLYRLLLHADEDVLYHTCRALRYRSIKKLDQSFHSLICDRLVEFLSHNASSTMRLRHEAYETLLLIVRHDPSQAQGVINGIASVNIVCNDSSQAKYAITGIENTAPPRLLKLLDNSDDNCQQLVCWVIRDMIANDGNRIQLFIDARYVTSLIGALKAQSCELKRAAAYAIVAMINNGSQAQIFLVSVGCLQPLCHFLESNNDEDLAYVLSGVDNTVRTLLLNLSKGRNNETIRQLGTRQLCQRLVKLLSHHSSEVSFPSLAILAQILYLDAPSSHLMNDSGGALPSLMIFLTETDGRNDNQKFACWLIGILAKAYPQELLDANFLAPLIKVLMENEKGDNDNMHASVKFSTFAVINMIGWMSSGSPEQKITANGCLRPLRDLLTTNDIEIRRAGLCGLEVAMQCGVGFARWALRMLADAGICKSLVKSLLHDSPKVHCSALITLGHIFRGSSVAEHRCKDTLPHLLNLLTNGCVHVQGCVCYVLYWMTKDEKHIPNLVDAEFFVPLIQALTNAHLSRDIARFALPVLLNMLNIGPSEKIECGKVCFGSIVVTNISLRSLCALLATDGPARYDVLLSIKCALKRLSSTETGRDLHSWGFHEGVSFTPCLRVVRVLVDSGVCGCVVKLLSDINQLVRSEASEILTVEFCHTLWLQMADI